MGFQDAKRAALLLPVVHSPEQDDLAADYSLELASPAWQEAPVSLQELSPSHSDAISAVQLGPSADLDVPAALAVWSRMRRAAVAVSPSQSRYALRLLVAVWQPDSRCWRVLPKQLPVREVLLRAH